MSIVEKIIGFLLISLTLVICGCEYERCAESRGDFGKVGAFNDEVYVWEHFQFTTNRVIEVR